MDYITIGGRSVPYPNDFTLEKVPNLVNEITTMSGQTLYDTNGWKYADTDLKWDTLLEADLTNLLDGISTSPFVIECEDIDGQKSINAILRSRVNVKTRLKHNGKIVWKDITVTVSFPDCYQEE